MGIADRFNQFIGKTRYVVSRIFIHLEGAEVAPFLGVLNQTARDAVDSDGEMETMGENLVTICESLLQYKTYWKSASNEGDVFWDEGEAGDFVNELFTDSSERYLSQPDLDTPMEENEPLWVDATENIVVMIIVAFESEKENLDIETNLADSEALEYGLKALINLHYNNNDDYPYRAIQFHFSPAKFGDKLDSDQILLNFSELVPL